MKTTKYFQWRQANPDRSFIKETWIMSVIKHPVRIEKQADGRFKLWGKISEYQNRYLRVVLLEDGETIHNAFFDRGFKP